MTDTEIDHGIVWKPAMTNPPKTPGGYWIRYKYNSDESHVYFHVRYHGNQDWGDEANRISPDDFEWAEAPIRCKQ